MAASRSRLTRANRRGKNKIKDDSLDSSTKAQKGFDASIFDFNEPESEEFDVKSTRRNFRKRKNEGVGPKNKHHDSSLTSSKSERIAKKKESDNKSRNRGGCEDRTLDLDKKLFATVVNDNNRESEKNMPVKRTELVNHQRNERIFETQNEDKELNNQETSYQESIIEKSIKRLEKLKARNIEQNNSCGNGDERLENKKSYGTATPQELANDVIKPMNFCPVCLVAFAPSQSDSEIAIHVNDCLDLLNRKKENSGLLDGNKLANDESKNATNQQKGKTDEDLAKELQDRENAKVIEEKLSNDLFFCGICQKDLNRLSAESRQIHINRCADFSEKENAMIRRAQRKSLRENSKEFECLICGEMFSSMNQKVAHIKKCWKQNNVDGKELLQLLREISSSNASLHSAQAVDNHLENSAKTVNDLLKSNTSPTKLESRRSKKIKRKKASNEEIPVLLTRSEEEAQKMALLKATKIIEEQVFIKSSREVKEVIYLPESKIADKYKRRIYDTQETAEKQINESNKMISSEIFKKNDVIKPALSLWEFSDIRTSLLETPKFYVHDIFEEDLQRTIKQLKKNKYTEDVNIQKSPKMDNSVNAAHILSTAHCDNVNNYDTPRLTTESTSSKVKDNFTDEQSKNVAVVDSLEALYDGKKETIDVENETGDNGKCSGFLQTDLNEPDSSGLKMKLDRIASKAKESLISSLELLLNDEESKDINLLCADGKVHKAHSCILFLRCPTLKKGGNAVELTRFKETAVVAALKFIYTGGIDTEMENPQEVYELAKWLSLDALAEACAVLVSEHEASVGLLRTGDDMVKANVEDLEKTLWHADQDTEEDEEESSQMGFGDCDSPFDQSDEEDLRLFIATQRDRCDPSDHNDDEMRTSYHSKETIIDKMVKDNSAEDGEHCLSHKEDGFASLTGGNEEPISEPCQYLAKSVTSNAFESDKDTQRVGLELIDLDSLSCSSSIARDEDCAGLEDAHIGSLPTVNGKEEDGVMKYKSDSNELDVDRVEVDNLDTVPKDVIESDQKCDRNVFDFPERSCSDTCKATTSPFSIAIDIGENADQKTFGSKMVNRTGIKLDQQSECIEIADCDNVTTGLQIVDLRSPNPRFDSDEEDLFNSSGGLDMAICLDNNEDHNAVAEDQIDEEDESKIQKQNSSVTLDTPDIATPKPFERTLDTPYMFSSDQHSPINNTTFHQSFPSRVSESDIDVANCEYENNGTNDKCDSSDAYSDRCDSDSVELNNDSAANKSTLSHNDPVSPCVTTSQYERKSSSDSSDHFDRSAGVSTARSLPSISQTTVICLDDDETSDDEREDCTTCTRGVNVKNSTVTPLKSSCQNDSARHRYCKDAPVTEAEADSRTPVGVSTDETDEMNERGDCFLSGNGQCVNECLVGNEEFLTQEIPKKDENREHSFKEFIIMTPSDVNLSKERLSDFDDKSSDEIIEVNRVNKHQQVSDDKSVDRRERISAKSGDMSEHDISIEVEGSSSPILQDSSPEFLPPSCDKRKRYTMNLSLGSTSLKRKALFDREPSLCCNEYDDTPNAEGMAEDQLPARKANHTTVTAKISPNKRRSCGLINKSSCTVMSDERSSQDYDKRTLGPFHCGHHEGRRSDSSPRSDSPKSQANAEDDEDCRILSCHSFADSFDDGGFNPDIHYESLELNSCTFVEGDTIAVNKKENDEENNENEELRKRENVVEIDSENDMFDFSDDGGFDGDIVQDLSPTNDSRTTTKYSSGVCNITGAPRPRSVSKTKENLEQSTTCENRLGHMSDDLNEAETRSVLLNNIDSPIVCEDGLYLATGVENSLTHVPKTIVGRRREKQSDEQTTRIIAPTGNHIATAETPCSAVRAFGPGCAVHPESGTAITPMSDYEALQTPVLIKRVKQYGLRKLPKHQMAGKLREIYKIQHGFTNWEEPPTKPKRKRKDKETICSKKTKTNSDAIVLVQESGGNHSSDSETSSDDERQKTFEGFYSDDESSSQASSQVDQTAETLSKRLMKFVTERKELYEKILTYQKMNFEEIYRLVKEAKIKCSKSQLTNFLDEQCICFVVPKADDKPRTRKRKQKT